MISEGSVDGEYIMSHIQDDRVFEIFNPLDHNDSNYGIVTKGECEAVYNKYKKKYSDKQIKWKNGKKYKKSLEDKNNELPIYKKVVWHCKDENKYDPETATKEEKENYKRCDSDPNIRGVVLTANGKMFSGGGGLFSTMSDYYNFTSMILNQGEFNGKRIIGRKTIDLMAPNHLPDGKDLTEMSESSFSETPYAGVGFGLGFSVMMVPA